MLQKAQSDLTMCISYILRPILLVNGVKVNKLCDFTHIIMHANSTLSFTVTNIESAMASCRVVYDTRVYSVITVPVLYTQTRQTWPCCEARRGVIVTLRKIMEKEIKNCVPSTRHHRLPCRSRPDAVWADICCKLRFWHWDFGFVCLHNLLQ